MSCPDSPDAPHSQSWTTDSQATRTHTFRGEHETHQAKKWLETPRPNSRAQWSKNPLPPLPASPNPAPHSGTGHAPTAYRDFPRSCNTQCTKHSRACAVFKHKHSSTPNLSSLAMLHWTDVGQESGGPRV